MDGYQILRSDVPTENHRGYGLGLADKAASPEQHIKKGNLTIVQKPLYETSRSRHLVKRMFDAKGHNMLPPTVIEFQPDEKPKLTWSLGRHDKNPPFPNAEETFLRVDFKDPVFEFRNYVHGPMNQNFWSQLLPGREYIVEFYAPAEQGNITGFYQFGSFFRPDGPNPIPGLNFTLTNEWQKFKHKFTVLAAHESGHIDQYILAFKGPGVVDLGMLSIRQASAPFGSLTPEESKRLTDALLGALHTHNFIKTGRSTYSMQQLFSPAGAIHGTNGNTLPQPLEITKAINSRPWLQMNFHMSPEEWQGLVEYLAAPYDPAAGDTPETKPWAARRYLQGCKEHWANAFDKIYFELSNETWNNLFLPWFFTNMPDNATDQDLDRGTVYGLFLGWVIDLLKVSPYWAQAGLDGKVEFVIGGWAPQTDPIGYSQCAIVATPRSKHLTIAAYNGGWDEGEGPVTQSDASLQSIILHAPQVGEPRSREYQKFFASEKRAARGNWVNGVYKAGPGYALSSLNNQPRMTPEVEEAQARAMKSLASAHKVTLFRLAGDPRAHNLNSEAVKTEKIELSDLLQASGGGQQLTFAVNETTVMQIDGWV